MRQIWIGPDLPQRIKDSDKKWAEGAKPINVRIYILFKGVENDHPYGNKINKLG